MMWHFARCDATGTPLLGNGDGREVKVGETLTIDGEPVLCRHGLHASARVLDALQYCNYDACLCEVELGGTVVCGDDKSSATERTVMHMLDCEQTDALLREFARHCALTVAHLWDMPEEVRQYLETGDESLMESAYFAAHSATYFAARNAAHSAAYFAAESAAESAAHSAAYSAAYSAAWGEQAAWLEARANEFMNI